MKSFLLLLTICMVFKLAASTGSYKKLDDMLYDIDDMLYDTEADESYEDEDALPIEESEEKYKPQERRKPSKLSPYIPINIFMPNPQSIQRILPRQRQRRQRPRRARQPARQRRRQRKRPMRRRKPVKERKPSAYGY